MTTPLPPPLPSEGLLRGVNRGGQRLRELLGCGGLLSVPGCYDPLSARLVESSGFDAAYMTGFGTAAAYLGRPDVGLLTMTEMVDAARRIVDAISVPLIADADTGYGNVINVVRTVHAYERAGVAGIQIEDQVMPKKCGHMAGKAVVPLEEAVQKVRAAVAARQRPETVLIARTDARAVEGLDAALERGRAFRDSGADVLFIEALLDEHEIEHVAETFRDTRLLFNWVDGGATPPLSLERIASLGYSVVIFPISTLLAATRAMTDVLAVIRSAGTPGSAQDRLVPFDEFTAFLGLDEIRELEQRFGLATTPGS